MLTPLDIHNKAFSKVMRGYKMEEVDEFLDEVIRHYETLFRENHDLKERVKRMEEEVSRSEALGETLQKTMLMAQQLVDDETARAKKESELIQWEAKKKGEQLIQSAQQDVLEIKQEIERLKLFEKQLYLKHKGFLEFQMELLNGYQEKHEDIENLVPQEELPYEEALTDEEALPLEKEETRVEKEELTDIIEDPFQNIEEENDDSMAQVFMMAQKMEAALKNLDALYGAEEIETESEKEEDGQSQ